MKKKKVDEQYKYNVNDVLKEASNLENFNR